MNTVVVPGTVFGISTLPLALFGSHNVAIHYQDEHVFAGEIRHVASPYLALATVFSIGSGIASVAVGKWRQFYKKNEQLEAQLSNLESLLKDKEKQLEELKLSESRLAASGLSQFIENDHSADVTLDLSKTIETPAIESAKVEIPIPKTPEKATDPQFDELQSQLKQIQAQLAWLNDRQTEVKKSEDFNGFIDRAFWGMKVQVSQEQSLKKQSQLYREKYENLKNHVQKFSIASDSPAWDLEVDIEIAIKVIAESGNDKAEVEKVLAQSDRVNQWKGSLSEDIAQIRTSKYIEEVYSLAEELINWRELHLLVPTAV